MKGTSQHPRSMQRRKGWRSIGSMRMEEGHSRGRSSGTVLLSAGYCGIQIIPNLYGILLAEIIIHEIFKSHIHIRGSPQIIYTVEMIVHGNESHVQKRKNFFNMQRERKSKGTLLLLKICSSHGRQWMGGENSRRVW